jgi:hypothetical protein
VANNEINATKHSGKLTAISITMRMRRYNAGWIAQWSTSTRSHWMPPLGECSHHIAAAAVMADDFGRKHKTLTKNYF